MMSDYATPEAFKQASQRRFADVEVPGVGRICIRSLTGSEFAKVKSAIQRRVMAAHAGKTVSAKNDESVEYVMQCLVHPESKQPLFSESDRSDVASWDTGLLEHVSQLCANHCELPNVEDAEKN